MRVQKNRALRWLMGLLAGIGLFSVASTAQAQNVARTPIPQHWISYADMVGNQFAEWLSDPADEAVVQLHAWLQDRVLKEGKPPLPPLVARVWVSPMGMVSQLELPATGDARIDAALRRLLMSRVLPEPPPPDMRQPMLLQLSLDFPPVAATS
ncbi:YbaB/EbfC family DNA-binding protein [Herbaspirillum sp. alder98]|uniref:YbaB/EbfC family DNA-binding protein n=1 Tax=Herbaspirillum sp. alder98 TaxID=2913096 RepID=UPI001CD87FE2|nr:YbaB/EbfC family DNA-binding protein [Herbaspirillum sp. alder98]MCA1325577.1 YbaB/EbfC family DNA-binding protein [Herbaspirillum sp. alder98]